MTADAPVHCCRCKKLCKPRQRVCDTCRHPRSRPKNRNNGMDAAADALEQKRRVRVREYARQYQRFGRINWQTFPHLHEEYQSSLGDIA